MFKKLRLLPPIFAVLFYFLLSLRVFAQPINDTIYNSDIHTIQIYKDGWKLSYPIYELNSDIGLVISFDDLSAQNKKYWYTLVHCNAEWIPENLNYNEYMDGFEQNPINSTLFSTNTTVTYVHHSFNLPNEDVVFKVSGNYMLYVFEDNNLEHMAFTRKIYVAENNAQIDLKIIRPQLPRYMMRYQQYQISIKPLIENSIDLKNDVKCFISKNLELYSQKRITITYQNSEGTLFSDDPDLNIIPGGNEYRNFDIKSIKYQSPQIQSINFTGENYVIQLYPDEIKNKKNYFSDIDINGRFYIENSRGNKKEIDADYVKVNFTLASDFLTEGEIYVMGNLSNWKPLPSNKLSYNFTNQSYECSILLKQGYYNYNYYLFNSEFNNSQTTLFEGDHYETENDYILLVYYKNAMDRYERLLSYKIANSMNKASN